MIGNRYGKLRVFDILEPRKKGLGAMMGCICDCGSFHAASSKHLLSGKTRSCGCFKNSCTSIRHFKHGMVGTRIYNIWSLMKRRCYDEECVDYKYYGGRGITICDEWRDSFINFFDWASSYGYSENLTIDRINNNGNYEPSNCRWVTRTEQTKNMRHYHATVEFCGREMTLKEIAETFNLPLSTVKKRYSDGDLGERICRPFNYGKGKRKKDEILNFEQ